jgi:heme a synthase
MQTTPVYDFGPTLGLLLIAVVLAAVPVLWWLLKNRQRTPTSRLYTLIVLVLFLTFDLVLFGAFTRLSDSGLGCPDWPGCYGSVTPMGAQAHIDAAQAAAPTGPVTTSKAWIEMLHRKMATAIGALITLLMVLSWVWRKQTRHSPWVASFTFVWVCVQGAFGAWTVTLKLFPAIVTLHLLGGMVLLFLLAWQVARNQDAAPWGEAQASGLRPWVLAGMGVLFVQMALGAWVSTNYAVLACDDFPQCRGQWWPPMDFENGFQIWHELGHLRSGASVDLPMLTAIHMAHRLFALVVLGTMGILAAQLIRQPAFKRSGHLLAGLLALQVTTGLANVVLGWPLLAALLHTGGAAAMVILTTMLWVQTRRSEHGTMTTMQHTFTGGKND